MSSVKPRILRDYASSSGFFEVQPDKIEEVIKIVTIEGFAVPFARTEVNDPTNPHAPFRLEQKYLALRRLFNAFSNDLQD